MARRFLAPLRVLWFFYKQRSGRLILPETPFLDEEDAATFLPELEHATYYLEYGAGGSTVAAAKQCVKTLSVESDKYFVRVIEKRIEPLNHNVTLHYADIGVTGPGGGPVKILSSKRSRLRYSDYVFAPEYYIQENFFDLMLIDGRFRVACALFCLSRAIATGGKCLVCIDDYTDRPEYHIVEAFCRPERVLKHMAFFRPSSQSVLRAPSDEYILQFCNDSR